MPVLDWIGKKAVLEFSNKVPSKLLQEEKALSYGEKSGNLLVQGDNLQALKALLPYYAGQVKCIYIDPPYNSGEQKWTYNDHVDSPEIREWLGKVVGREAEDLSRHDKWLCMMYPRIKLLLKFLRKDGVLLVSLDDTELANFRLMMQELLPPDRFISSLIWKSRRNVESRNETKVSVDHEYVLAYHGGSGVFRGGKKDLDKYKNPDNDPRGPWMSDNLVGLATRDRRPNLHFDLIDPATGINYGCPKKGWRYEPKVMDRKIEEGRILWPKKPTGRPRHKKFLRDLQSEFTGFSSLIECGNTNEGTEEVERILGKSDFIFPKPRSLVEELIEQVTEPGDIVLDSFAGSGTTGHAVLSLNKNDGYGRRFILIEMEKEICKNITAERLRRVASGFTYKTQKGKDVVVEGLGGGFKYLTLGHTLVDENGQFTQSLDYLTQARYVYFLETREVLEEGIRYDMPLIGTADGRGVYLLTSSTEEGWKNGDVLTPEVLASLPSFDGQKIIYGAACTMSSSKLKAENVIFRQVPYDVRVV